MKAVVYSEYGGPEVLQLAEVPTPLPASHQILVRVHAAALNPVDWHFVRGMPFPVRMVTRGLRKPPPRRRVGGDFSGTIAALGSGVSGLTVGEAVFGYGEGALAEYVAVPANQVTRKPDQSTFEQAAGVPLAGLTALQVLRDHAKVKSGQHVLIVGAGGGIGTFAVQIARAFGAQVTGVQSTSALELVRSIGATWVIDYTKEDFTTGGTQYDVVFDNVSNQALADVLRVVKPGGVLVPNDGGSPDKGFSIAGIIRLLATRPFIPQRIALFVAKPNRADLQVLAGMIDTGAVTPVIDRSYPLSAAADAFRHLESGHAHGKIVVSIATP